MTRATQYDRWHNERWIHNPERRIGAQQMLRARLAGMSEDDPRYQEFRAELESGPTGARARRS